MKVSLRKGSSHIHVTFKDEDYSNNITAENFEIDYENTVNRIYINIESNLKQNNKLTNSYSDTRELIRKADQIKFFQIDEEQMIKGLLKARDKNPKSSWELVLHAGSDNSFKYIVEPFSKQGSVFLNIVGV